MFFFYQVPYQNLKLGSRKSFLVAFPVTILNILPIKCKKYDTADNKKHPITLGIDCFSRLYTCLTFLFTLCVRVNLFLDYA